MCTYRVVSKRGCGVWPSKDIYPSFNTTRGKGHRLLSFTYQLPSSESAEEIAKDNDRQRNQEEEEEEGMIRHYWYYGWKDFSVPSAKDWDTIMIMAQEAARAIK